MAPDLGNYIIFIFGLMFVVIICAVPTWFIIKTVGLLLKSVSKIFTDITPKR